MTTLSGFKCSRQSKSDFCKEFECKIVFPCEHKDFASKFAFPYAFPEKIEKTWKANDALKGMKELRLNLMPLTEKLISSRFKRSFASLKFNLKYENAYSNSTKPLHKYQQKQ